MMRTRNLLVVCLMVLGAAPAEPLDQDVDKGAVIDPNGAAVRLVKGPVIDPNGLAGASALEPDGTAFRLAKGAVIDPNGGPAIEPDGARAV